MNIWVFQQETHFLFKNLKYKKQNDAAQDGALETISNRDIKPALYGPLKLSRPSENL